MSNTKKKDSTFIYTALEAVYKNEPSAYANRSITGRRHKRARNDLGPDATVEIIDVKKKATPEKIHAIQNVFKSRIDKLNLSEAEYVLRYNNERFNKLLNAGFQNLTKKYSIVL